MKKILFGAMSVMLLASCSQDEELLVNNANDEIKFSVIAPNATRAAEIFCNNNLPDQFDVKATYNGQIYIENDLYTNNGNNVWENPERHYWPDPANPVRFYAVANHENKFTWGDDNLTPTINNFTVKQNVNEQLDLVYAVAEHKKPEKAGTPVTLNFRHALSQVVFKAKNTNENIRVEILNVTIKNIHNNGTYVLNTTAGETTKDNTLQHEGNGVYQESGRNSKSWVLTETLASFTTNNLSANPEGGYGMLVTNDGVDLTYTESVDATTQNNGNNILVLMPQEEAAWTPGTTTPNAATSGALFLVKCKIWNIAGNEWNENDVVLWDEKDAAIPVDIKWEEGKRYTYTFIFDENGNGGYDPNEPDTPVLFPITFDVTVDDFVDAPNQDVNMTTTK